MSLRTAILALPIAGLLASAAPAGDAGLKVGDEAFFRTLRTYYDRYKGRSAGTQDLIAVAEEVSGQELSPFFSDWLYSTDLPALPGDAG